MDNFNFSKANNLVLSFVEGDAVLLNDDTEVTCGWLEKMRRESRGFALVGARTNFQCSGNSDMWDDGKSKITYFPINMFCAFIPHKILKTVGLLDEEYNYYGGEDVDYSCRCLKNGFPLLVSSAFVKHYNALSYRKNKDLLIKESNKILFERYRVSPPFMLRQIYPLVSVIIATRNRSKLLPFAVKSITNGSYKNLEVIIVDDASTDDTWEKIEDLQKLDSRIIGVRLPYQHGSVLAREKGIMISGGDFISFMDDDDIAKPKRVISPLYYLQVHPDTDVVYCAYDIVSSSGRKPGKLKRFDVEEYKRLSIEIGLGTLLIRRKVIESVRLRVSYERAIDFDWILRVIGRGYKIGYCSENVLDYNRRDDVGSHLAGNLAALKKHEEIINREKLLVKIKHR